MDTFYLILIIVLFGLAISDLVVGVSNDAVNFLNSAIGARTASFKMIMIVAAVGIVFGATFSSGMMEVARKGIFHPDMFFFNEIIIIFLAVMITDVILLDIFNTYGLPTSTTVSIVFELLGAAVSVSILKVLHSADTVLDLGKYINTDKALAIIGGILLSVFIAFTVGVIIQYLSRMIFTFDYEKYVKRFGGIWGGLGITAITYFILVKGAKGASFMTGDVSDFILSNTNLILLGSLLFWGILLQVLALFTRFNILKFIVLVGTFALAMAFAGNDLVNFIGVPLAGYESYLAYQNAPGATPDGYAMDVLAQPINTPTGFLIAAGLIMVITLWTSKKAQSVVKTSLDLGRQDEGYERFGSTYISRVLVRTTVLASESVNTVLPGSFKSFLDKRFDIRPFNERNKKLGKDAPSFDLIRASVTLVVASILISFATSLKLPLSTTYVTFMVAMGTSLADKAWGRESAVYRITGVISVIGGWFLTALAAFTVAFTFSILIYYGGIYAIALLVIAAGVFVARTHIIHKKRVVKTTEKEMLARLEVITGHKIVAQCSSEVSNMLTKFSDALAKVITALTDQNLNKLRKAYTDVEQIDKQSDRLKANVNSIIGKLEDSSIDNGHYYVQMVDHLRGLSNAIKYISKPSYDHIDNNHKPLIQVQTDELTDLVRMVRGFITEARATINSGNYENLDTLMLDLQRILKFIDTYRKNQVKRIKANEVGTRNSILFLNLLAEFKNFMLRMSNLLRSHKEFREVVNFNQEVLDN